MRLLLLSFCFFISPILIGQKDFRPDINGYVSDTSFHKLIRQRGYGLVRDFDTVSRSPLLVQAVFEKQGKWGIINQYGIEVILPVYDYMERFEQWYRIRQNGLEGLITVHGDTEVPLNTHHIDFYCPGSYYASQGSYYNLKGEQIAAQFAHCGRYMVQRVGNNKIALADRFAGTRADSNAYDEILSVYYNRLPGEGSPYFWVESEGQIGIIDSAGHAVLPAIYEDIDESDDDDYFVIRKNKKYGLVNLHEGRIVVPAVYDEVKVKLLRYRHGKSEIIRVKHKDYYGLTSLSGRELIPARYRYIEQLEGEDGFEIDMFRVRKQRYSRPFFINSEGRIFKKARRGARHTDTIQMWVHTGGKSYLLGASGWYPQASKVHFENMSNTGGILCSYRHTKYRYHFRPFFRYPTKTLYKIYDVHGYALPGDYDYIGYVRNDSSLVLSKNSGVSVADCKSKTIMFPYSPHTDYLLHGRLACGVSGTATASCFPHCMMPSGLTHVTPTSSWQ